MKQTLLACLLLFFAIGLIQSCDNDTDIANPYHSQDPKEHHDIVDPDTVLPAPVTIQALQKLIFEPTCANSGCHDGLFEPDFRTVESTYNSLINRAIIKQDTADPITFRVFPGNSAKSMLVRRLEVDLNGNSGAMPLVVEPNSDWPANKLNYIELIKQWIDSGALDQNGNPPQLLNYPPELLGVAGYKNGNLLPRSRFQDPIEVNAGSGSIEVWFAYSDDKTPLGSLGTLQVYTSKHAWDYTSSSSVSMSYVSSPKTEDGFKREPVEFYHKVVIDLSSYVSGEVIWLRTTVDDGNTTISLPGEYSSFKAKTYAAIKIL
jgi:hypothetical protein